VNTHLPTLTIPKAAISQHADSINMLAKKVAETSTDALTSAKGYHDFAVSSTTEIGYAVTLTVLAKGEKKATEAALVRPIRDYKDLQGNSNKTSEHYIRVLNEESSDQVAIDQACKADRKASDKTFQARSLYQKNLEKDINASDLYEQSKYNLSAVKEKIDSQATVVKEAAAASEKKASEAVYALNEYLIAFKVKLDNIVGDPVFNGGTPPPYDPR